MRTKGRLERPFCFCGKNNRRKERRQEVERTNSQLFVFTLSPSVFCSRSTLDPTRHGINVDCLTLASLSPEVFDAAHFDHHRIGFSVHRHRLALVVQATHWPPTRRSCVRSTWDKGILTDYDDDHRKHRPLVSAVVI